MVKYVALKAWSFLTEAAKGVTLKMTLPAYGLIPIALLIPGVSFAQTYPSKTVRMIVPFPPGGANDILGRILAQKLAVPVNSFHSVSASWSVEISSTHSEERRKSVYS